MSATEVNLGLPGGVFRDTLDRLKGDLVAAMQGLPYLFARASYGDELTLHFGQERRFSHPKLEGKIRGSHVLSVRGSAWLLRSGVNPVMIGGGVAPWSQMPDDGKPFNVTALESGALIKAGARVEHIAPAALRSLNADGPLDAIGLQIDLDDGSAFMIFPTPPDEDEPDLPEPADWELLIPTRLFRVGPGADYVVEPL